ncbi:hypothetical protein HII28_18530 [Planctomonas sp. JC2975]|uniref:hypothetical protein n=1 Tax=Planctomonas sp. JC2975 TaxID=2729626 RepID=UPI001473D823|nr:hypothetical protein [Planctomonas sp. JC2975]NNC13861.1 hypothetical protein [Planctomonas sp. JC2975]
MTMVDGAMATVKGGLNAFDITPDDSWIADIGSRDEPKARQSRCPTFADFLGDVGERRATASRCRFLNGA